jgi:hypothetical protein
MTRPLHLVGSVNLSDAEEVFRTSAEIAGENLERFPDGETGERKIWTEFQWPVLQAHPLFEEGPPLSYARYEDLPTVKLRSPDTTPDEIEFEKLGYRDYALASYEVFKRLRDEGVIPEGRRFQVSLPTPLAVLAYVTVEDHDRVEPAYQRTLIAELHEICDAIPAEDLAIQWDICQEMVSLEGLLPTHFEDTMGGTIERISYLGDQVPEGVQLGYHLCYGSWQEEHFVEPKDTGLMVELANGVLSRVKRPVDFLQLPVPRERDDDEYFAPLAALELGDTQLFLGLLHTEDGLEGAQRRIAAAERTVSGFGLAAECGFGRGEPETMVERLRLHAEAAAAT